jgi:HAD superfamily hydrolase (TIGR01459 family)
MTSFGRAPIPILASVSGLSETRRAWLCDVWGVLHDGATVFDSAVKACRAFQQRGGQVLLISNSPQPSPSVLRHLGRLGVPEDCFDGLITSGDVTRALVDAHRAEPVFHLGPQRDKALFEGLSPTFVPAAQASVVVCTGLVDDEHESPEDYDDMLGALAARRVLMICANPDLVVERGDKLLPCAGALAARYAALGQTVVQAGKPYRPIYDAALSMLTGRNEPNQILAIGDGLDTDIKGACAMGIDSVYVVSRVHVPTLAQGKPIDSSAIERIVGGRAFHPIAAMASLTW